jgi:chromosome segregation ATPase
VAEQTARSRSDAQAAKLFVQLTDQTQQMSVLAEKSAALEQRAVNAELARDYAVERIEKLEHQLSDAEECLEAERKTVDSLNSDNEASAAEIERLNSSIGSCKC